MLSLKCPQCKLIFSLKCPSPYSRLAHCSTTVRGQTCRPTSDTLSRFRDNQSLLFLLNAVCLAMKQQIPILQSLVYPIRSRTHYIIRGGSRISSQGGGAHLKKLRRAEGGVEIFGGISCEKSRFYAKKSYFFQFQGGARRMRPLDPPLIIYRTLTMYYTTNTVSLRI